MDRKRAKQRRVVESSVGKSGSQFRFSAPFCSIHKNECSRRLERMHPNRYKLRDRLGLGISQLKIDKKVSWTVTKRFYCKYSSLGKSMLYELVILFLGFYSVCTTWLRAILTREASCTLNLLQCAALPHWISLLRHSISLTLHISKFIFFTLLYFLFLNSHPRHFLAWNFRFLSLLEIWKIIVRLSETESWLSLHILPILEIQKCWKHEDEVVDHLKKGFTLGIFHTCAIQLTTTVLMILAWHLFWSQIHLVCLFVENWRSYSSFIQVIEERFLLHLSATTKGHHIISEHNIDSIKI